MDINHDKIIYMYYEYKEYQIKYLDNLRIDIQVRCIIYLLFRLT